MDIVDKLRAACVGQPAAIQWPHRGLHEAADEIERLREALAPFDEAYRIGAKHCKYQTLGEWEALAKHHTKAGAYRSACLAMAENNSYLKEGE